jgi:antitoxin MazE
MQVLLSKWGNSLGLRLPKALTAEIGVTEGQKVEVRAEGGRIIVEPVRAPLTWDQMLENTTPEAMREAWDWGEDVGREIVDD